MITHQEIRNNKLCNAAFAGDLQQCKALLDAGADVNFTDNEGWATIHRAVSGGHVKICALLAKRGANLQAKVTNNGKTLTPMQLAVCCEHTPVVYYFVKTHGEDLFQITDDGKTLDALALEMAGGGHEMRMHLLSLRGTAIANAVSNTLGTTQGSDEDLRASLVALSKSPSL